MKKGAPGTSRLAVLVWPVLVIAFLSVPILLATFVAFSSGDRLEFPVPGFSLRWFEAAFRNVQFLDGLLNSIIVAVSSAALATVAGTGAAIAFIIIALPAALPRRSP